MGSKRGTQGKKIDTWEVWRDNDRFQIDVRMERDGRHGDGFVFVAICTQFDLKYTNKDINALRKEAEAGVKAHEAVKYEPKLMVRYHTQAQFTRSNEIEMRMDDPAIDNEWGYFRREVEVEIERMLVGDSGKRDREDKPILLQKEGPDRGSQQLWGEFGYDAEDGEIRILLDDTLENRIALQAIMDGMDRLKAQLGALLMPENIKRTIKQINAGGNFGLLPAAKIEEKK